MPQEHGSNMKMHSDRQIAALRRRYGRLAARVARLGLGLVLQGTITERTIDRPDRVDHQRRKVYGPYYQWTWKHEGKTITVNLTASQARAFQRAIDNHRKLTALLGEMRTLSRQILEATTVGVKKRKPRTPPDFVLS